MEELKTEPVKEGKKKKKKKKEEDQTQEKKGKKKSVKMCDCGSLHVCLITKIPLSYEL